MYALYNLLLALPRLAVVPALRLPRFRAQRERLGLYAPEIVDRVRGGKVVWLHNASIGELKAARGLARRLREELAGWRMLVSTTSLTGRELARGLPEADAAVLLPLDFSVCIERALDTISPSLFVFTETEIWPNLLRALRRRGVPAVMVSGRISPAAFRRYTWIRPFLRRVLADVALFAMQSEREAERIRALGAPPERVRVTGSLKLETDAERPALSLPDADRLWISASTHAGEEEICARVFVALRARIPGMRWLCAPRHLDRVPEVEAVLRAQGLGFVRRSQIGEDGWSGEPPILLLDTLGELSALYAGAAAAFVGGTLVPVGGHNLLEPARSSVPVLFGPHVDNVAATAETLERCGGGFAVKSESELAERLTALLADPDLRRRMGRSACEATRSSGTLEANLQAVLELAR